MLYLLIEKEFADLPWCRRSLRSLYDEVRKKRLSLCEIETIEQIPETDEEAGVLLIGGTETWFRYNVALANNKGHYPISMTNRAQSFSDEPVSSVTMDFGDGVRLAVNYLHSLNRNNLALYGVNPHSSSDPAREAIFTHLTGRCGDVYRLESNMEEMFRSFMDRVDEYDAVVCVNDYAAVSLVRNLRQAGYDPTQKPYVVGFGNMKLTERSNPSITSVTDDYEHFGRAAISIYNLVVREKSISSVNIQLHCRLIIRQTTGNRPYENQLVVKPLEELDETNNFYQDTEVVEMARMESLLHQCDETDHLIIKCLVRNLPYAEIAEKCFISETAAKYRVKKMESICGVTSRSKLIAMLKKYF